MESISRGDPGMITIRKIKAGGEKITIEYKQIEDGTSVDSTVVSSERARPELYDALANMSTHVVKLCELPNSWQPEIEIRGVTFSEADGIMGATITALRPVKASNAPFVVNTPHTLEASPDDAAPSGKHLTSQAVRDLKILIKEATEFVKGKRAQQALEFGDGSGLRQVK
jgi:hypothetical protein